MPNWLYGIFKRQSIIKKVINNICKYILLKYIINRCLICDADRYYQNTTICQKYSYYFPIINRLSNICKYDENIRFINSNQKTYLHENYMNDISHGTTWKLLTEKMGECFIKFGFGISYDGVQPFNRSVVTLNVFSIYILNYPIYMRFTPGIGIFLVYLVQNNISMLAEDQLFILLMDELNQLWIGIQLLNAQKEKILVKGAVIYLLLDTKGYEKIMKVQGPCSYSGCYKCMDFKGRRYGSNFFFVNLIKLIILKYAFTYFYTKLYILH